MKLALSNIAIETGDPEGISRHLAEYGVEGLVIAPTMVWPEAPNVNRADAVAYSRMIGGQGLRVVGLQSLVFGRTDVALFGSASERHELSEHLKRQAELAGILGASSLVFGSPGLRKNDTFPLVTRNEMAADLFRDVAATAADYNTRLTIEPLSGYGNKFVTTTQEGIDLVKLINHPGFGLHLDSAAMAGADEDSTIVIPEAFMQMSVVSYDISAPELGRPSLDRTTPHKIFAHMLRAGLYAGPLSIEMRGPQSLDAIAREIEYAQDQYGL